MTKKCDEIHEAVSKKIKLECGIETETTAEKVQKDFASMLANLKTRYHSETNK